MKNFKFKVTMVVIKEFSIPADCYPEGSSIEDVLKIEQENFSDDPHMAIQDADITVNVKVVD